MLLRGGALTFAVLVAVTVAALATSPVAGEHQELSRHKRSPSDSYSPWTGKKRSAGGGGDGNSYSPWVGKRSSDSSSSSGSASLPEGEQRRQQRPWWASQRPKKFLPWVGKRGGADPAAPGDPAMSRLRRTQYAWDRMKRAQYAWDRMRKRPSSDGASDNFAWDRMRRSDNFAWDRMRKRGGGGADNQFAWDRMRRDLSAQQSDDDEDDEIGTAGASGNSYFLKRGNPDSAQWERMN